ncbi:unnamed protein product [Paramecium primaurelia]|uniref:Uncharacterized protein n=1 Tax=Paramecium primaurelia TaxID=5886 RepID=A0A8S1KEY4_PARPR|nr:unnamed protein product [Paramecium primaurelia]
MNLQNYNREGRNYKTERVRQISPSSKLMHLSNQEISFYVSKYGDPQENTKDSENTKYFMSLIQPLLEENYQLKDTILNLTEALKLDKELLLETISQIVKDKNLSSSSTISEILEQLTISVKKDRDYTINLEKIIEQKNMQIQQLQEEIENYKKWKIDFIQEKNLEVEVRTSNFFKKMQQLEENNTELSQKNNETQDLLNAEQLYTQKLNDQLSKFADDLNKVQQQKQELQLQLSIAERQIYQEKQDSQKRLNDQISQLHKDHYQQIEQLKIEQMGILNELKKQILDYQEEIKNLELSYTASLDKNLNEIKRLQQQLQDSEKQIQVYKKQELANLDNLSKIMMEKRDKDQKLKNINQIIVEKDKQIDNLTLDVLQLKSKLEQAELKCTQQITKYKQKYKEKIQVKVIEAKKDLEQKITTVEQEKKKLSEDFKQQIIILDVQKTSLVKECKADNEKLRDEIEDLEFKLKDLDNMWDFKYAKLKMEYDRLKLEIAQYQ